MSHSQAAVELRGVSKIFVQPNGGGLQSFLPHRRERVTALEGVNLQLEPGQVVAVAGPNGAGKSTLLGLMAGLLLPDEGRILVKGQDTSRYPEMLRAHIGYVVAEERSFYYRLTGRRNLTFFAAMGGLCGGDLRSAVENALEAVGLAESSDLPYRNYSTGMKQRLCLARGVLQNPEVLLLDEPTRGLDPMARKSFRKFLKQEIAAEGNRIIVMATHSEEDIADIATHLIALRKGQIIYNHPLPTDGVLTPSFTLSLIGPLARIRSCLVTLRDRAVCGQFTLRANAERVTAHIESRRAEAAIPEVIQSMLGCAVHVEECAVNQQGWLERLLRENENGG